MCLAPDCLIYFIFYFCLIFDSAAQLRFEDIANELKQVETGLKVCSRRVDTVVANTDDEDLVQPFKDIMESFIADASSSLQDLRRQLQKSENSFKEVIQVRTYCKSID